jgi:hypothetical protein
MHAHQVSTRTRTFTNRLLRFLAKCSSSKTSCLPYLPHHRTESHRPRQLTTLPTQCRRVLTLLRRRATALLRTSLLGCTHSFGRSTSLARIFSSGAQGAGPHEYRRHFFLFSHECFTCTVSSLHFLASSLTHHHLSNARHIEQQVSDAVRVARSCRQRNARRPSQRYR